ncbi:MAG: serine/threonine-protein kinase, partial [Candidatus Cloacimonadaceae bacterium]|nr:serine/threonine-protein kinase [Candidatus Cloacimonadaceae bacterium]
MELTKGVILRDYHIISLLGEGGMGEVYLAEEVMLGRQVAIKRLSPNLTKDAQFSERFINEARIQARLIHPNIVALYNFFVEDGVYYMVMEYAEGNMLKELIAMTGPIPEPRALHIFKQIVNALAYAHS